MLTVFNSTIAYNSAYTGGGIANNYALTVVNSTIAYNTASASSGGGGLSGIGTVTLNNTIVAGNLSGTSADDIPNTLQVKSSAYNLIGTGGSGGLTNGVNGNQVDVANPELATDLTHNGGPTQTIALLKGSPAIDKGSNTLAVDPNTKQPLATDQRGTVFPRIVNGTVDIGAFEFQATPAAVLQSIAVTPANPSVPKGETQQFTATGTYSDNSTQNLTSQVTWASATTSVATITSAGLATAVATGTSNISATLGGVSGSTVLTVTAAALQSIAVTPANPSVPKGKTQQFTATGTYSDNSTQNLTSQVTWASATTSVATITSAGLATAVATGTSNISAKLGGVSGSTVLTVTAAALQSIAVTPANPSVSKGETQQFTATGTYSDSTTQNLTSQVTWASATTSVATITSAGLATAVATGTSNINATLGGVSGSTVLTVTAAALQSIAVTPANPSVPKGETQQFTATGTYSDNSTKNLTSQVTWASATTSVATITSAGLATAVATGTSNISATLGGVSGSTVLTVTTAPTVTAVTSTTANGSYGVSSAITITVGWSKPVIVTGTPQLALNSGGTASYSSGSGTSTLTFIYTVAAGQNSSKLDYTSTAALTLNGGTIVDTVINPNAANLTLPAPDLPGSLSANKNIQIDTVAPTVLSYNVLFGSVGKSYNLIGSTRLDLPWTITGIQVVFSKPIATGNLNSLTGLTTTAFAGLGTNTLTWSITSLTLGSLATALLGTGPNAIEDVAGNELYGGTGFAQSFKVLYGDFNGDGVVSAADMAGVNSARFATYNIFADLSGDGVVDIMAVTIAKKQVGTHL